MLRLVVAILFDENDLKANCELILGTVFICAFEKYNSEWPCNIVLHFGS
jgi:hypothetical protein